MVVNGLGGVKAYQKRGYPVCLQNSRVFGWVSDYEGIHAIRP